jgi:hypothetical protein
MEKSLKQRLEGVEEHIKDLQKTNHELTHEIKRLQAVSEIQNLMGRYEYFHAQHRNDKMIELYAQKAPGVRFYLGEIGYWEGTSAPARAHTVLSGGSDDELHKGRLHLHPITTPVIEIAGDGKTAKGVWITIGIGIMPNPEINGQFINQWTVSSYGVDFIKEDDRWKFWRFHIYRFLSNSFDKPFSDYEADTKAGLNIPPDLRPDGPAVDDYPYRRNARVNFKPDPPEPFETFDLENIY